MLLAFATSAHAATFYVSPTGSDDAAGTSAAPFKTLQVGAAALKAGDTLNVRAGTYEGVGLGVEVGRFAALKGTADAPITIQLDPAATGPAVITSGNREPDGITLMNCQWLTIRGLKVNAAAISRDGIRIVKYNGTSGNINILNCEVTAANRFGVYASATTDLRVEGCNLHDNPGVGNVTDGHNIYITGGCTGTVIRGNTIARAGSQGLHLNADGGVVSGALVENNTFLDNVNNGINCDGLTNSTIRNNLIVGSTKHGISMYKIDGATGCTGNTIANNTIYNPASAGAAIKLANKSTGNKITDNALYGGVDGSIAMTDDSKANTVCDYNVAADKFKNATTDKALTFAQWRAANPAFDAHSTAAAAGVAFMSPPDLHPLAGGPLVAKGSTGGTIGYLWATTPTDPAPEPYKSWPLADPRGDVNGDGVINFNDMLGVTGNWNGTRQADGTYRIPPATQPAN